MDMTRSARIGVFLCDCGSKVSSHLNLAELTRATGEYPTVVLCEQGQRWCLPSETERLRSIARDQRLDRALIAGCSPRTHNTYFRRALAGVVEPALVETFNLRDLYAVPARGDTAAITTRAGDQLAMAITDLENRISGTRGAPIAPHAVVIGGGIAGLTAASDIAAAGIPVTLVERSQELGGGANGQISGLVSAVRADHRIRLVADMEVTQARGTVGHYEIELRNGETVTAGALILATGSPPNGVPLAQSLGLAIDTNGYLPQVRRRLRPADRIERGIFVCGAAHRPCDTETASFEASLAAAHSIKHIRREHVSGSTVGAGIHAQRCNGCGDCARVCPFSAVTLVDRPESREGTTLSHRSKLASVDPLLCTGCGNCVSVCPVDAVHMFSEALDPVLAQVSTVLGRTHLNGDSSFRPIFVLACEWSGYSAAEIAGARGLSSPDETRLIRIHCTGRLSVGLLLRILEMGAAGAFVLGCAPGHCHYERGNEHAAQVHVQAFALGRLMDMEKRLALLWVPPDDGAAYVKAVDSFIEQL